MFQNGNPKITISIVNMKIRIYNINKTNQGAEIIFLVFSDIYLFHNKRGLNNRLAIILIGTDTNICAIPPPVRN